MLTLVDVFDENDGAIEVESNAEVLAYAITAVNKAICWFIERHGTA